MLLDRGGGDCHNPLGFRDRSGDDDFLPINAPQLSRLVH
jgi:hypothetical protein